MNARELTKVIGALSLMADRARTRGERKRLRRLVHDLCLIAEAIHEVEREEAT